MTRVLISAFDTIVGLGLCDLLVDRGCEVLTNHRSLTPELIDDLRPDALIVDMDDCAVSAAAEELIDRYPGIPIVQCSSASPVMRVFPAYRFGKSIDLPLSAESLVSAVTGT
jgi:hypothetical protein